MFSLGHGSALQLPPALRNRNVGSLAQSGLWREVTPYNIKVKGLFPKM